MTESVFRIHAFERCGSQLLSTLLPVAVGVSVLRDPQDIETPGAVLFRNVHISSSGTGVLRDVRSDPTMAYGYLCAGVRLGQECDNAGLSRGPRNVLSQLCPGDRIHWPGGISWCPDAWTATCEALQMSQGS